MANLAQAIHTFQSGDLSRNEFFAQIDRVLASEPANSSRLLELLKAEQTRTPLPDDIYAEVQRRLAYVAASKKISNVDETRLQTNLGDRLTPPLDAPTNIAPHEPPAAPVDRMKGVGDTLNGRFVLEECIGFGGMGTVYKALDLRKQEASDRNPYIAIKVLNVQFRGHPKSLIALQREARKAQTLAHPNIVTVYDFDRDGSMVYLTMEYLTGKPLSRLLRTPDFKGLPYPEAYRIVNGIARALAYAHERGFVHCDLKPGNIFLTDKGEVKVIDFGIARVFKKPEEDAEATVFDAGSLGGMTPAYASPEMLEHREPDPRDDIYALACITYELLTGRHPFDRLTATQARGAAVKPLRPNNLGQKQWRALRNALSFERETRTPTIARFLQEFGEERRTNTNAVVLVTSMLIAVLAAAAFGYYWMSRNTNESEPTTATVPSAPTQTATAPAAQPAIPTLSIGSVAPILAKIPCSALLPSVRDHALQVDGFIPKSFGVSRLKEMLGSAPGVGSVTTNVQQVDDKECDVIKTFAPYWIKNRQAEQGGASIHTKADNNELKEGDPLIVDITTPSYDSYVYVDYHVLDGHVAHLVPNQLAKANQAPPNYTATIGSLGNWVVSKPFGNELIVLLTTPTPLFDSIRPEVESRADYLQAVEKQLEQIKEKYGSVHIAVDIVQITTEARKP
ncbi:MAG TPA: serine/threonine-protein kinase [Burkholderiaceae bacterium]|jgi:serine/threonine protein kinase